MLKRIAISVLFITLIIPTAVRAGETISERQAERVAEGVWWDWQSERWSSLYDAGTFKSRSNITEAGFIAALNTSPYRVKSFNIIKIKSLYSGGFDAYAEAVFGCKSGFSCPEKKKLVNLSFFNEDGDWRVWLGDIIYGGP